MAEAEDVIIDAARHASVHAADLWRRNRAQRVAPPGASLLDLRRRLELFAEAVLNVHLPVRTASEPAPRTVLARWLGRGKRAHAPLAVAATDGASIYLPGRIEADPERALELYRALTLQQAARVARGSVRAFPWLEPPAVQDLYLIAETAAIEAQLARALPGLARTCSMARAAMRESRRAPDARDPLACGIDAIYRLFLAAGVLASEPSLGSPAESLDWARTRAAGLPPSSRYRGLAPDLLLGRVLEPEAAPAALRRSYPAADNGPTRNPRSAPLSRRPRARREADDEDDPQTGLWMIQTTQPHEHAEDAMGLQRPIDQEPEADLVGASESISELESLRLVSSPGRVREAFVGEEPLPPSGVSGHHGSDSFAGRLAYPEWDYIRGGYVRPGAVVRRVPTPPGSTLWVDSVLGRQRATLARVRRRFEALRSRRCTVHGQIEGDDVDLQAFVNAYGDRRARLPPPDRLYVAHRPARRDFALLLLVDASGSTDAWCGGTHRIVDLEKEALMIVATALQALRARFAIQSFSGHGPGNVRVGELKRFDEGFDHAIAHRIAALEPDEFTRLGAALRHATAALRRESAHRRLLLLLSDGKPNDCDRYEGRYGFEDARQALAEARLQGIAPFCVTVDHHASHHLAPLFGPGNFSAVNAPQRLAGALLEWLRSVTVALA